MAVVVIIAVGVGLILVVLGFIWATQRIKERGRLEENEALLFEREMLGNLAPALPRTSGAAMPTMPGRVESVAPPPPRPREAQPLQAPGAQPTDFTQGIAQRLRAANLLAEIEGPVRTLNAEAKGTILRLRNNKRVVVLDELMQPRDAMLANILRHYDGVLAPGPAEQVLFIDRFENFLSGMVKF